MTKMGQAFLAFIFVGWAAIAGVTCNAHAQQTCRTICWTTPNGSLVCQTTCAE